MNVSFESGTIQRIVKTDELPKMVTVKQKIHTDHIPMEKVAEVVQNTLKPVNHLIHPEMRIGITAGSRGIDKIDLIIKEVVKEIKRIGAIPFIVPCMGSHGNTAEGQKEILKGLNITEETMQCPICSYDQLVCIGNTTDGRPVYVDEHLWKADGIIVINRIKAHTAFHGEIESGLCKMMAVGMGKREGASSCHRDGFMGMENKIRATSNLILASGKILFGIGIIENTYGQVCYIESITGERIAEREPQLLKMAKSLMPAIPFSDLDVLIVDEMGKDISGSGMDTNVIGRYPTPGMSGGPRIRELVVLSLTEASEGSGHGMGFADFISNRLFQQLDFERTYVNGLTNRTPGPAKIPPVMPNDECAIKAAIHILNKQPSDIRMVRIQNTHKLDIFEISESLLHEKDVDLTVLEDAHNFKFDEYGQLISPICWSDN